MTKVTIVTGSRSERYLSDPIMKAILADSLLQGERLELKVNSPISRIAQQVEDHLDLIKPQIVLCMCDRREMVTAAMTAYYQGLPIFHYFGGSVGSNHPDEAGRWAISRFSHVHLCFGEEDREFLKKSGEEEWRMHVVGTTSFDGVEILPSGIQGEYDLLVLNPDPLSPERTRRDALEAVLQVGRKTIAIEPNEDRNREVILDVFEWSERAGTITLMPTLSHGRYLSLMRDCVRAIGNSSSFIYELPYFDAKKWIPVGVRNRDRTGGRVVTGASQRIVELLKTVPLDERLMVKRFRWQWPG